MSASKVEHFPMSSVPKKGSGSPLRKNALYLRRVRLNFEDSLEKELARYFLLSLLKEGKGLPMFSDSVDECWHDLILDTHFYRNFCDKAFGFYLNHIPRDTRISVKKNNRNEMKPAEFEQFYESVFGEKPDRNIWNHLKILDTPQSRYLPSCKDCCPCCSA